MPDVLQIEPIAHSFAARVRGIDFRAAISPIARKTIIEALEQHHVLVFPDQQLDKAAQLRATLAFGELDEHAAMNSGTDIPEVHTVSNLNANGEPRAGKLGSRRWHSDKSYRKVPSLMTLLYAVKVPASGGDTQFADMRAAFAALPTAERARVERLRIVHSWADSVARAGGTVSAAERDKWPPVSHPLARAQPDGHKALFMGEHAACIEGLPPAESKALMSRLHAHATQERFIYQHRWRAQDLLMWDNRCLLHRVLPNFKLDAEPRLLHRTVTRGTAVPV